MLNYKILKSKYYIKIISLFIINVDKLGLISYKYRLHKEYKKWKSYQNIKAINNEIIVYISMHGTYNIY